MVERLTIDDILRPDINRSNLNQFEGATYEFGLGTIEGRRCQEHLVRTQEGASFKMLCESHCRRAVRVEVSLMGDVSFETIAEHTHETLKTMQDAGYVLVKIGFAYIGAFNAFSMEAIYRKPGVPRPWPPGYVVLSGATSMPGNTTSSGWW